MMGLMVKVMRKMTMEKMMVKIVREMMEYMGKKMEKIRY